MKKDLQVLFFLGLITCLVYFKAFNVFFAQDDFILINHFSQNTFLVDLGNAIGAPKVSHWRPMDNLYYLITGNVFGKNYLGYHIFTFLLHVTSVFFIYKLSFKILHKKSASFFCSWIYAISPVHFVSLSWISGNATLIAFMFYIISLYLYTDRRKSALIFYFLSLLAFEAFIFTSTTFLAWDYLSEKRFSKRSLVFILVAFAFVFVKMSFFTPLAAYETYQIGMSFNLISTLGYYLLRLIGFAESSGDLTASLVLAFVILFVFSVLIKNFRLEKNIIIFSLFVIVAGLFPFILLKDHASPHYMNLSLFGFSLMCAIAYLNLGRKTRIVLIAVFTLLFSYSVNLTYYNSWVIKRSLIAKSHIDKIKTDNLPYNSRILFEGNDLNASEVYYSLGGKEALKFFFRDKNYNVCFDVFENCKALP